MRTFCFHSQSGYHAEIKTSGTQHLPFSFERAKIHLQHSFRPRSEPRKAVPSLNVPTCAFFENNLIPGKLKLKALNMEHFVQRQSGDSFCDQLRCPIFQEKLIQSKRINFNRRLLLKNCFSGSRKRGPPFEPQFCAQKWRNHNLGEEPGKPKPSISARAHLCKSYGFGSHKGKVPFRNFHSPWRFFGRNAIFTVNWEKRGG